MATIVGTEGADVLNGTAAADVIEGLAGDDQLDGGAGDDRLIGGTGGDALSGAGGDDVLVCGTGVTVLDGGAGFDWVDFSTNDSIAPLTIDLNLTTQSAWWGSYTLTGIEAIRGDSGNDTLIGSSAANTLDGGLGANTLTGGAGDDTFLFSIPDGQEDVITDFTAGGTEDRLVIHGFSGYMTLHQRGADTRVVLSSTEWILLTISPPRSG